jgi:hypothetical protein
MIGSNKKKSEDDFSYVYFKNTNIRKSASSSQETFGAPSIASNKSISQK